MDSILAFSVPPVWKIKKYQYLHLSYLQVLLIWFRFSLVCLSFAEGISVQGMWWVIIYVSYIWLRISLLPRTHEKSEKISILYFRTSQFSLEEYGPLYNSLYEQRNRHWRTMSVMKHSNTKDTLFMALNLNTI